MRLFLVPAASEGRGSPLYPPTMLASLIRPGLRSSLMRRFGFALVLASVGTAGGVAAIGGYVHYRLGQVERIPDLPVDDPAEIGPMNIVLVGSDDRAAVPGEESRFGTTDEVAGRRSDTIMLARVEPAAGTVALLSIPRDTYLPISGGNSSGRINEAYNQGGPQRLIQTIADNLRISVHHYVEVDFSGFRSLVDVAGGVRLCLSHAARDWDPAKGRSMTGLDLRQPGCQTLDGTTALAYVRSRFFQTLAGGRWKSDPSSDIGRIGRQQVFLLALAEAVAGRAAAGDPRVVDRLSREATDLVRVDAGFDSDELLRLGASLRGLRPQQIELLGALPTTRFMGRNKQDLQRIDPDAAAPILARFATSDADSGN